MERGGLPWKGSGIRKGNVSIQRDEAWQSTTMPFVDPKRTERPPIQGIPFDYAAAETAHVLTSA